MFTSYNFFAMITIGLKTTRHAACAQKQNIQLKQLKSLKKVKPYWQKMQNGSPSVASTFKYKTAQMAEWYGASVS